MDWKRTKKVIPLGVQTLSKAPSRHVEGIYPKYIKSAYECDVYDGEKDYIDYTCGLGPIILGYSNNIIDQEVRLQTLQGTLYGLPHWKETLLAEKLCEIIPCAEMVRFLKTGSEAVSASIKIGRSYTQREHIASFGYHGWHDWCQEPSKQDKGIPKCYKRLMHQFKYNDLNSLKKILKKYKVAAVIIEPYVYEPPQRDFLRKLISFSHRYGALVIFDEIVTGFRTPGMSAQKYFRVTPDLSCFSKAMGNGYPIAAVVGKRKYMKELEKDCFVSSTFAGDLVGIVAALETIKFIEKHKVIDHIWKMGKILKDNFNRLALKYNIDAECIGYPCRTYFKFPTIEHKSLFWQECLWKGILFGYAQFISYAHKREHLAETINAMDTALEVVKIHWDNPKKALKGKVASEGKRE